MSLTPRKVTESALETTHLVLPNHTNHMGNIFGGTVMSWVDIIGACISYRHCRCHVVTASMDDLHFIHPVKLGYLVTLKGSVNYTGSTSLEVGVKIISENPLTGIQQHTATSYLTFVAIDEAGKPIPVPPIEPITEDEKRRYLNGEMRRAERLARRQKMMMKLS